MRTLLEYLYLDVKVRSPDEIQDLTNEKLESERKELTQKPADKLIAEIRSFIEVLLTIKNKNEDTLKDESNNSMESPTSSMPPFAKDKNSVKSVSLFSNKDRGLNYYSNLSERQGRGTIDDQILRKKKRVV